MADQTAGAPGSPTRMSINLSVEATEALKSMTSRRGITLTEAIRRAISSHKYLDDAASRGARVYIEEPDGSVRELIFTL